MCVCVCSLCAYAVWILIVQEEEHIPSLLAIRDINASMADVALELATRNCHVFRPFRGFAVLPCNK